MTSYVMILCVILGFLLTIWVESSEEAKPELGYLPREGIVPHFSSVLFLLQAICSCHSGKRYFSQLAIFREMSKNLSKAWYHQCVATLCVP